MLKFLRLSPADAADPAKLDAFAATLNALEEEAFEAGLLPKIEANVPPDGSVLATVMYAMCDSLRNNMVRPVMVSEFEKKLDRAKRDRLRLA